MTGGKTTASTSLDDLAEMDADALMELYRAARTPRLFTWTMGRTAIHRLCDT